MKALKYIGLGGLLVLLTIGCSDFLKEYSQDTYYVSSYEDLDELLAGDGYLPVNGCGSNMGYFIHFLADEIEEQIVITVPGAVVLLLVRTISDVICLDTTPGNNVWDKTIPIPVLSLKTGPGRNSTV